MQICWEILNITGLIISFKKNKICGLKMEVLKSRAQGPTLRLYTTRSVSKNKTIKAVTAKLTVKIEVAVHCVK